MRDSKMEFPDQTGYYRLDVKSGAGWRFFNIARLHISVGQEYHEGEKFIATMEWVKHRFDKVIVCVNDTLQRHNDCFASGMPEQRAFIKSDLAGQHWLMRNAEAIKPLPNYEIQRWEEWRTRPEFKQYLSDIVKLYEEKDDVREKINSTIKEFWTRIVKRDPDIDPARFSDFSYHSKTYLLEETAIFFMMYKENEAVDIYPGSRMVPFEIAQAYSPYAPPPHLGAKAFTAVSFTLNKSYRGHLQVVQSASGI